MKYFEIEIRTETGSYYYSTFALNSINAINTCLAYLRENPKQDIVDSPELGGLIIKIKERK